MSDAESAAWHKERTQKAEEAERAAQHPRPLVVNDAAMIQRRKVIATELLSLYEFLTELHIPAEAMKRPPAEGWDFIDAERFGFLNKTDAVIDLYKHLPYIRYDRVEYQVDYHCHCYDWTGERFKRDHLRGQWPDSMEPEQYYENNDRITWEPMREMQHIALLFEASSSFGSYVVLDTRTGKVASVTPRDRGDAVGVWEYEDISEFTNSLKRDFLQLELIPLHPSCVEPDYKACYAEINQRIKEAYRRHGWPSAGFQKEACFLEIGRLLEGTCYGAT